MKIKSLHLQVVLVTQRGKKCRAIDTFFYLFPVYWAVKNLQSDRKMCGKGGWGEIPTFHANRIGEEQGYVVNALPVLRDGCCIHSDISRKEDRRGARTGRLCTSNLNGLDAVVYVQTFHAKRVEEEQGEIVFALPILRDGCRIHSDIARKENRRETGTGRLCTSHFKGRLSYAFRHFTQRRETGAGRLCTSHFKGRLLYTFRHFTQNEM